MSPRLWFLLISFSFFLGFFASGCGTIEQTQTVTSPSDTPPVQPSTRGEPSVSADASTTPMPLDALVMTPETAAGQGADRGDATEVPVSPVCPPELTCDVTSQACRDLCPTCTARQDGKCISDGFCVCR